MTGFFKSSALAALFLGSSSLALAAPTPIDLNNFTSYGQGTWNVATDGDSVLQTVNGQPTAFVSNDNFFNTQFEGSFQVQTESDNDWIGFVFGFDADDSTPFYLFDWKKGNQGSAPAGFTLSEVSGGLNSIPFNSHQQDASGYDVLAVGPSTGWVSDVMYDFTLEYTESLIKIDIAGGTFGDGQTIFNIQNSGNTAGRFGFYNFSQANVFYQGFTETVAPTFCELNPNDPQCNGSVPAPAPLALLSLGLLALGATRRKQS